MKGWVAIEGEPSFSVGAGQALANEFGWRVRDVDSAGIVRRVFEPRS